MDTRQPEQDLQFIKQTMEASTRYYVVPPLGYLAAGVLGLAGPIATWLMVGDEVLASPDRVTGHELAALSGLWGAVLLAAMAAAAYFTWAHARKLKVAAWSPPARRMFLSQVPQLLAAGILTLGLLWGRHFTLIPGLWLLSYGLVLFAFHYYTGTDHLIQSSIFLLLGTAAAFAPVKVGIIALAVGFGAVNLGFGVRRIITDPARKEA